MPKLSELSILEEQSAVLLEKLGRLRKNHAFETDEATKFKLENQIRQTEQELSVVEASIARLSHAISSSLGVKIHISSPDPCLAEALRKTSDLLNQKGYEISLFEPIKNPLDYSIEELVEDFFMGHLSIVILTWCYGRLLPHEGVSFSERLCLRAIDSQVSRLFLLLSPDAPWPASQIDRGPDLDRIDDLRSRITSHYPVVYFDNIDDLHVKIDAAVSDWAQERLRAGIELLRIGPITDTVRHDGRRRQTKIVNTRPLDVTSIFKDRLREIAVIVGHLTDKGVRLISLLGRGGMGKTALASLVLGNIEEGVPLLPGGTNSLETLGVDGIIYLNSRSTGLGLDRIYRDVGRMLGDPLASDLAARWISQDLSIDGKIEFLLECMQNGVYLILLDNLEDQLDAEGEIAQEGLRKFVERCLVQPSGVRLIVTSRMQIKVPVSGLHAARSVELTDGLQAPDAIDFLRQLDTEGGLGLRTASDETLRRVQELTRGIPRALEFVAGILREHPTLGIDELVKREDLFGEEVVEKLVAAAYHHLERNAQRVMQALSIYDRPVGATEVTHLLYPWLPGIDVKSCLRGLARSYFVRGARGHQEYSLHPLDQRYAYEQIPGGAKADEDTTAYNLPNLHRRAADFYRSIRLSESRWKTIDDIAPLLSEFRHHILAEDYDSAAQVLAPLDFDGANYLNIWGYTELLAELRGQLVGRISDPRLNVANLGNLGFAYRLLGRYDQARNMLEEALSAAYEVGDRSEIGVRLGHLGVIYRVTGQIDRAIELCRQAADIAKETGHHGMESNWLGHLATAYRSAGKFPVAVDLYKEALDIAKQHGDRQRMTFWMTHLGITYSSAGEYDAAITQLQQALDLANAIGSRRHQAICLDNMANTKILMGQYLEAIDLLDEALVISRQIGVLLGESYHLLRLARAKLQLGFLGEAKSYASQSLALNLPETNHQAATVLGIVMLRLQDPGARHQFTIAIQLCYNQLTKSSHLWEIRLSFGTALVGLAVSDVKWSESAERPSLLQPAIREYVLAVETCHAPGIIAGVIDDLRMIQAAGIAGLEAVFSRLQLTESSFDTPGSNA